MTNEELWYFLSSFYFFILHCRLGRLASQPLSFPTSQLAASQPSFFIGGKAALLAYNFAARSSDE